LHEVPLRTPSPIVCPLCGALWASPGIQRTHCAGQVARDSAPLCLGMAVLLPYRTLLLITPHVGACLLPSTDACHTRLATSGPDLMTGQGAARSRQRWNCGRRGWLSGGTWCCWWHNCLWYCEARLGTCLCQSCAVRACWCRLPPHPPALACWCGRAVLVGQPAPCSFNVCTIGLPCTLDKF
jgi:hypothetical protein